MKKVYICSRYRADETRTVEENVQRALEACRKAALMGYAPYAPHLYLPRCLDDDKPEERELGLKIGQKFLKECDEVWLCDAVVSEGMRTELALAEELGIPVRFFSSADMRISESMVCAERRGEWITKEYIADFNNEVIHFCSLCGLAGTYQSRFCPNCGAKMDGKEK